ncbi:carboxymuconolactone decarboxylase family protein [Granulicella rosea]|nr:carboxymuconolactone decarboxylase family protein [Granulicella rosea]
MQRSCKLHHRPVDLGRWRLCDALSRKARAMRRRELMKTSMALLLASAWGEGLALAREMNVSDLEKMIPPAGSITYDVVRSVSPVLEHYSRESLLGGLWKRPELSPRDRSVVTIAAIIARLQTYEMPMHFALALDNGVKPAELSEIIAHLAFYAGWGNAMAAVAAAKDVFQRRNIAIDQLPPVKDKPLPLDEAAERQRATQVAGNFGAVSPGLVRNTTELLFLDLWLRPALAPRDRSLVTVSALIANGQTAQMPFHLNRAMDNGLTQEQAAEVLTHIAFYAGWPCAMSALPVAKDVFEKRQK